MSVAGVQLTGGKIFCRAVFHLPWIVVEHTQLPSSRSAANQNSTDRDAGSPSSESLSITRDGLEGSCPHKKVAKLWTFSLRVVGEGGEITKSLGNIYSQDVPTGRPGTSLYDVLQSFLKYSN